MHTIAFEDGGTQEETVSAFLMLVLEEAQESGLFGIHGLLDQLLHIVMKTVRYSPLYKAETMIASLVMGCAHTKAINDTLGEEEVAANYLGMLRFPDQSQINRYLTRFTAANVEELGEVHAQFLRRQSRAPGRGAACGRHRPVRVGRQRPHLRVSSQRIFSAQAGRGGLSDVAGLSRGL